MSVWNLRFGGGQASRPPDSSCSKTQRSRLDVGHAASISHTGWLPGASWAVSRLDACHPITWKIHTTHRASLIRSLLNHNFKNLGRDRRLAVDIEIYAQISSLLLELVRKIVNL